MAGEKSVLSGEAGQLITKRLLSLCGLTIAEHIQFNCLEKEKHKSKGAKSNRGNHDIDGLVSYDSPLNHSEKKVILISAKHHIEKYQNYKKTKIYSTIKDLAQSISCSINNQDIHNRYIPTSNGNRNKKNEGLVTFLSSSQEEQHVSIFKEKGHELSIPSDDFNAIYFIDNKRATFLFSAIMVAKSFSGTNKIGFIHPDTGSNQSPEVISRTGTFLPIELMCSDVLPILSTKNNQNHVLIFCNDKIEKDYLKRIIWLVHRLCAFANNTTIFFPDYDSTLHDAMVNIVKQGFQESDYLEHIAVRKYDALSFIRLKEEDFKTQINSLPSAPFPKKKIVKALARVNEEYDKILPFGRILRPILASANLSASDLKNFLKRKGIFVKYARKDLLIPLFVNMILSPNELDILKGMLIEKEENRKSLNKSALFVGNSKQLKDCINAINLADISIKENCSHLSNPNFIQKDENRYELEIELQRLNSTKELISGTTHRSGLLVISVSDGKINVKTEYTSIETKDYLNSVCEALSYQLQKNQCINQPLKGIKFSDFKNNQERVSFLSSFKDINYSDHFFNGEIVHIKFKPDEEKPQLPPSIEEYKGKVKNLNINGNTLETLSLILKPENQDCIYLSKVKIQYRFDIEGNQGKCVSTIHFPSTLNAEKVDFTRELEVEIEIIRDKKSNINWKIDRLQARLSRELIRIVVNKYYSVYQPKEIEELAV